MFSLALVLGASVFVGAADKPKDIVDTAVGAGSFKTLAAALKAADLVDTLKGEGPFTVFAPTDEAFAKLPAGTVESLLKPENKKKLIAILTYHVVAGKVMAADVVWSPERQQGFMRFRGLTVNETTRQQYQLWIFDKNQDEKTPVDGGVFDISSNGEVVIPIQAKLRVADVYLFAVTIEKPGVVVVSTRERLPLLAIVKKS